MRRLTKWVALMVTVALSEVAHSAPPRLDLTPLEIEKLDVVDRNLRAMALMDAERFEEATAECVWLWERYARREPGKKSVDSSLLSSGMQGLAQRHPPAKTAFTELRDKTAARLADDEFLFARADWMALNEIIGDADVTLVWFDAVKHDAGARAQFDLVAVQLEELLARRERWADLGGLYTDPISRLHRLNAIASATRDVSVHLGHADETRRGADEWARSKAATLYGALLAANRVIDADKYAACARGEDDSGAMISALVSAAVRVGRPVPEHLDWLKEATAKGEATDLLARSVRDALNAPKP